MRHPQARCFLRGLQMDDLQKAQHQGFTKHLPADPGKPISGRHKRFGTTQIAED